MIAFGAIAVGCTRSGPRRGNQDGENLSAGQLSAAPVIAAESYIPVYSNIVYADGQGELELSALLSIRNTDSLQSLVLESVRYYDSQGHLVRDELSGPSVLGPMATTSFLVRKSDEVGGSGANYLVRWQSAVQISEPVFEAVMVDLASSHSLAFTSRGVTTRSVRGVPLP